MVCLLKPRYAAGVFFCREKVPEILRGPEFRRRQR